MLRISDSILEFMLVVFLEQLFLGSPATTMQLPLCFWFTIEHPFTKGDIRDMTFRLVTFQMILNA